MTLATLTQVLNPAKKLGYAVAGLVVLGWEDARAYVRAAEKEGLPVILQAGPACREHTPLRILGTMFCTLGESSTVPVVAHLDHGQSMSECREAIDWGFTSVMYDGSMHEISKNIDHTAAIAEMAHAAEISCEGEIGFVGYSNGEQSIKTRPEDAARFERETAVDALAVSIGNVHLQQYRSTDIDYNALHAIENVTTVPLVIHGGSGIVQEKRQILARETSICKFNIGTELRMVFGNALRNAISQDGDRFDRIKLLCETEQPLELAARTIIRSLGPSTPR